jgi:hypothetical protein
MEKILTQPQQNVSIWVTEGKMVRFMHRIRLNKLLPSRCHAKILPCPRPLTVSAAVLGQEDQSCEGFP